MSIDSHINVTVLINNAGISKQGFGTIGILSYKADLFDDEYSLSYSRLADAITDGFAADSPEALSLARILSQSPHPTVVKFLRGDRPPTQQYTIDVSDVLNEFTYAMKVKGEGVTATTISYESETVAEQGEIHSNLVTQLNAVVDKNYTAAFSALTFADDTFTADNATDTFTDVAHGLQTGDGPLQVTNSGGALPTGLVAATDYWVIRLTDDTFQLASSLTNAFAGTAVTISDNGTGTHTLSDTGSTASPSAPFTVTADDPGNWFSIEVLKTSKITISQTHSDPGIADDLAEIQQVDSDWYWLHTTFNSEDMVLAAAEFIEATPFKAYIFDSSDTEIENSAATTDIAGQINALTYKRTLHAYHRKPNEMMSAGWEGKLAPLDVGLWTAAYKTISGVTPDGFTGTQISHLDAKKCSYYKTEAGRNITWEGEVGNTDYGFLDITVSLDFVLDLIQKNAFGVLVSMPKVGFTDEDIALLRGAIEGALDICKSDSHKIIASGTPGDPDDPEPSISFPKVADIDPSERAVRHLPDGQANFRVQGAVHTVDVNLTVTF